jgi:hypothetical protein
MRCIERFHKGGAEWTAHDREGTQMIEDMKSAGLATGTQAV